MKQLFVLISILFLTLASAQNATSADSIQSSNTLQSAETAQSIQAFLAPLQTHPMLQAARASVDAAQAQLDAVYSPVSLSATGGVGIYDNDPIDLDPGTDGVQGLPRYGALIQTDLTLRPFVFGDVADQATQLRLNLQQAQLSYLDALTGLEIQAFEAALNVQLAQESLSLAQQGAQLAKDALDATQIRFNKGAANERELRDAQAGYQEAQNFVATAASGLELAQLSLQNLVGDTPAPPLLNVILPTIDGTTSLSVQQAAINVELAKIGPRSTSRNLYPTLQASYSYNIDDLSTVGVSIESRTLQPTLSYDFQNPGRSAPQTSINGSLEIGVSMNISPGQFDAIEAAKEQLAAAQAGLTATQDGAEIARKALENTYQTAQRQLEFAQLEFDNAQLVLDETLQREALGLSIPLETQQASIELTSAAIDLQSAKQDVLASILDFYDFYAVPISEVIK